MPDEINLAMKAPNYTVKAVNKGADACTPSNPCGLGEGDCDADEDCKGGLICWQKENNNY